MITKQEILDNKENFEYLFGLQSSGRTNMFGASTYLQNEMGLDKKDARDVLAKWMANYDEIAKELGAEV